MIIASCVVAATANAAPLPQLEITCSTSCTLALEPPTGQPVAITSIRGASTGTLRLLVARGGAWRPCALPCKLDWTGVDAIRVRWDAPDGAMTFALTAEAPGSVQTRTVSGDDDEVADFVRALREKGIEVESNKVFGPGVVTVPSHVEATLVGQDVVVVDRGPADRSAVLDRYFDDVVAIEGGGVSCTAVAIGPRALVTAAHCAAATAAHVVGVDGRSETIEITHAERYPHAALDIAVLTVAHSLGLPIRPRARTSTRTTTAGLAMLVGFGTNDARGRLGYGVKRQAVLAVDDWSCTQARAARTGCRPDAELVVSTTADTCTGDSGGPVLERVGQEWRLAGITSRAIPGAGRVCGGGGIYTSVGAIASWLDEKAGTQ